MLAAPGRGDRGDNAVLAPEGLRVLAQGRLVGGRERQPELARQLLLPLAHQRGRRQHQDALGHAAQGVLLEHHRGLDGLAEPHLVGQQDAAAELLQHLAHGLDLVPQRLEAGEMRQAQQLVVALRQAQMGKTLAQAEPAGVAVRPGKDARRQRCQIDLHRERDLDLDARQGRRLRCGLSGRRGVTLGACGWGAAWSRCGLRSCLARRLGLADPAGPVGFVRVVEANGCRPSRDGIERCDQTWYAREAARKNRLRRAPVAQPMLLQERPGGIAPAKLVERKRVQDMCNRGAPHLREPAEERKRPLGLCVEHRRGGSQ